MFLNVPLDEAQKVIGEGITKFTFRLLSEKHCFEITCLDGTKWLVMQRYALPKRIADDNEAYNWSEFVDYYGQSAFSKWQNSEPEEDTKVVCSMRTGQRELLQINSFKLPKHNSKKNRQIGDAQMVTCRLSQPNALPMRPGYPPGLDPNPGAGNAEEDKH